MSEDIVLKSIEGSLATITLNRPDKRNALNGEIFDALGKVFDELTFEPDIHSIVIKGNGACFSAGIDLVYLLGLSEIDEKQLGKQVRILARQIQSLNNKIEDIEKPVIAVIHGFCGGLALELAMACDFRLGSASSIYGLPEIIMGLVPDCGGTTRLMRTLGTTRAKELVMLGNMITADRAERIGLITRVFDDATFEAQADAFIGEVLDRPQLGIGLAKRLVDIGANTDRATFMDLEATIQSLLITARDFPQFFQEGMMKIQAMKEKRKQEK